MMYRMKRPSNAKGPVTLMSQMYQSSDQSSIPRSRPGSKTSSQRYPATESPKTAAPKRQPKQNDATYKPSGARMKPLPPSTSRSM